LVDRCWLIGAIISKPAESVNFKLTAKRSCDMIC
jgi:hypothetical protein